MLELDPYKVGSALMMIAATSRQLGHKTIRGTVDPYLRGLVPDSYWSPEHRFVMDLLAKGAAEVITEDELVEVMRNRPQFNPEDL